MQSPDLENLWIICVCVLLMPLAETIKEFVSFMLKGVDLKHILFTYYQPLRNSYNVYTFMIRSNRNLFRAFPSYKDTYML